MKSYEQCQLLTFHFYLQRLTPIPARSGLPVPQATVHMPGHLLNHSTESSGFFMDINSINAFGEERRGSHSDGIAVVFDILIVRLAKEG